MARKPTPSVLESQVLVSHQLWWCTKNESIDHSTEFMSTVDEPKSARQVMKALSGVFGFHIGDTWRSRNSFCGLCTSGHTQDVLGFGSQGKHMSMDNSDFCRKSQGSRMSEEWRKKREMWLLYGLQEQVHGRALGEFSREHRSHMRRSLPTEMSACASSRRICRHHIEVRISAFRTA